MLNLKKSVKIPFVNPLLIKTSTNEFKIKTGKPSTANDANLYGAVFNYNKKISIKR